MRKNVTLTFSLVVRHYCLWTLGGCKMTCRNCTISPRFLWVCVCVYFVWVCVRVFECVCASWCSILQNRMFISEWFVHSCVLGKGFFHTNTLNFLSVNSVLSFKISLGFLANRFYLIDHIDSCLSIGYTTLFFHLHHIM